MNYLFHAAPFLVYGEESRFKIADYLKKWNAEDNILLVHGKNVKAGGLVEDIQAVLEKSGYRVLAFDRVAPDAPIELVREAISFARENDVKTVVAIGGGSANDIAKAVAVMLDNPGDILEYMGVDNFPRRRKSVLVAIPTTCGTGSETTDGGVIYLPEQEKKVSFWDAFAAPDIALLDPALLQKLPARLVAQTALDALAHAVEGYTSILANPISDAVAVGAIELIHNWLPGAYADSDPQALGMLLTASTMAGMSFNRSTVHLGHAVAHAIGAHTRMHHGAACAFALPLVLKTQAEVLPQKIKKVCGLLGLAVEDGDRLAQSACEALRAYTAQFGITRLRDFGVEEGQLSAIGAAAMEERIIAISPRRCEADELLAYLKEIY